MRSCCSSLVRVCRCLAVRCHPPEAAPHHPHSPLPAPQPGLSLISQYLLLPDDECHQCSGGQWDKSSQWARAQRLPWLWRDPAPQTPREMETSSGVLP